MTRTWLIRLWGLVRKELLQILRDPSSIAIAFALPLVLLLIHGYGISLDAEEVPVAVVLEGDSAQARDFVAALTGSQAVAPRLYRSRAAGKRAVMAGEADGVVILPRAFESRLRSSAEGRSEPAALGWVDGVDANQGRLIMGYLNRSWGGWLQGRAPEASGSAVTLEQRVWFNPEMRSRPYLVPGLIAIVMALIGALLTALVIAREWEHGTMEALLVTPITINQFLAGKVIPYFALGMAGMAFTTCLAWLLFDVPLRGSLWVFFATGALFLLAALGMGLLYLALLLFMLSTVGIGLMISSLCNTQQQALLGAFLYQVPSIILSGFATPVANMPPMMQALTYLNPLRYCLIAVRGVFLKDIPLELLVHKLWPMAVIGAVTLTAAAALFRRRLE
ncbi:ABC transporter permease [Thiohalorhabdus sp.]|uniref:ABC transporter permease n=1 Tax=Thiohalorhabdus sp. TaxID=3094134 RepID=UPI002FC301F2